MVPSFWEEAYAGRKIDLVIHIGMAGPRPMYQIESRGHRTGYKSLDVDGKHLDALEGERGEDWIWHGLPDTLRTDLNLQDIWERWQQHSSVNITPSFDIMFNLAVNIGTNTIYRLMRISESQMTLVAISATSSTTQVWQPAISKTSRGKSCFSTCLRILLKGCSSKDKSWPSISSEP